MANGFTIKRGFLYAVITALVLSAVAGICVLVIGRFSRIEGQILLTTVAVSFFSMMSLASAAAHEKGRDHRWVSVPGLALGAAGLVLYVLSFWLDWWQVQWAAQWLLILALFSFSFAQASVLSLVSLRPQVRWVFRAAIFSILAFAVFISGMILSEHGNETWPIRVAGVLGILDACFSLCVPIAHRLGGKSPPAAPVEMLHEIEITCPRCGHRATYPLGKIACREQKKRG